MKKNRKYYPLVLTSFDAMQQSRDGAAPFIQEANFYWLTGINEPGWRCIITSDNFYVVAPERDDQHYIFEGGLSDEDAIAISGADTVLTFDEARQLLADLAKTEQTVYTLGEDPHSDYYSFTLNPAPDRLRGELGGIFSEVSDCRVDLAKERALKNSEEIASIEKAIAVTTEAFAEVKRALKDSTVLTEYEIEALFSYKIRSAGATGYAYEPIVASGSNALTLHYAKNSDTLPRNGLVLLDVGARADGYAADITRTYAIGEPSQRETAVHAAVERAHVAIIDLIAPGVSIREYHDSVDAIMKTELQSLGLLKDVSDNETYRRYFPHAISHGLGIDVHESLGGFDTFQTGMVLTVEPGIYIPEEGIGVRIEDDILVTPDGRKNLSGHLSTGL